MENRITISICDEEYTFVAEEAPSYMQKVGSYVNDKMSELLDAAKVGRTDAAVLTAVNITDELCAVRSSSTSTRLLRPRMRSASSSVRSSSSSSRKSKP